jgi:hypothetical protein
MTDHSWHNFLYSLVAAIALAVLALIFILAWAAWHLYVGGVAIETDARRTVVIAGGAMTDAQKTLAIERRAAQSQIVQAQAAETAIAQSAASLDRLVRHTDASLNDPKTGLLPAISSVPPQILPPLQALETQAGGLIADLRRTNGSLGNSLDNFDVITRELATQLPPVLADVRTSSDNVADITSTSKGTSAHVEATAADLHATADDVHAWVHRELAPVHGAWHAVKSFLFGIAGPAANVATALK